MYNSGCKKFTIHGERKYNLYIGNNGKGAGKLVMKTDQLEKGVIELVKRSKKSIMLVAGIISIVIVAVIVYVMCIRNTIRIKSGDVQSINVEMLGAVNVGNYGENNRFTVKDEQNINYIIDTLKAYAKRRKSNPYPMTSVDYKITVNLKKGATKEYTLKGFSLPSDNHMSEVLSSKEVMQAIRTVFTIDKSKIDKAEYYYWEETNADRATFETIKDREVIEKIIRIAQKDAMVNPMDSMEEKNSGFVIYDREGNMLLGVNISPSMEGYAELVKLFPSIPDHVEEVEHKGNPNLIVK